MLFAKRKWLFTVTAIALGATLVFQYWALAFLVVSASLPFGDEIAVNMVKVVLAVTVFTISAVYVLWVQKYYYYFKLMRLLNDMLKDEELVECSTPSRVVFSITGSQPYFTVTHQPREGNTVHIYHLGDGLSWAESQTTTTEVLADGTYFGERERIETKPLGIDQRATFKYLRRALDRAASD